MPGIPVRPYSLKPHSSVFSKKDAHACMRRSLSQEVTRTQYHNNSVYEDLNTREKLPFGSGEFSFL